MARPTKTKTRPASTKKTKRPAWEEKLLKEARAERRAKGRKKGFIRKAFGKKASTAKKRNFFWRLIKGTAKGTVKLAIKGGKKAWGAAETKIKSYKSSKSFPDGYAVEPGEIPKGKRTSTTTVVGNRHFDSPEAAMAYADKVAKSEPEVVKADRPKPTLEWTNHGKNSGKVRVRPVATKKPPSGRHREAAHRNKVDALIAAHRDKLSEIGRKAVMKEEGIASQVKRGFDELLVTRPGKLSGMEELALGMEQAMAVAAEAVQNYRMNMIKKNFDPADLMALRKIEEDYEDAALNWTKFIVVLKTEMADEIAAARRRMAGEVPSDEDLAG